jgi:hypothetical protein
MSEDIVLLAPLVSVPRVEDAQFFPGRLREVCRSLMLDFQYNNGSTEALLRRKVKSTKVEDISSNPFSWLEQFLKDYIATVVHLIILLLRSLDNQNRIDNNDILFSNLVPLSEPLQQSLQNL